MGSCLAVTSYGYGEFLNIFFSITFQRLLCQCHTRVMKFLRDDGNQVREIRNFHEIRL